MCRCVLLLVVLAVLAPGCNRTRLDMEPPPFNLDIQGKEFEIDPIKVDQTIKVTGTTTNGPVSVFVFLKKDQNAADREIANDKPGPNIIAHQLKTEQIQVEAKVPANEEAVVAIRRATSKMPNVKLKISNQ